MPYLDPVHQQLPYQSGSDTSREAAQAALSSLTKQRKQYFDWLEARGPYGGTDKEAELQIPMRRSAVCPRRGELIAKGLVVKTSARRAGCAVFVVREA